MLEVIVGVASFVSTAISCLPPMNATHSTSFTLQSRFRLKNSSASPEDQEWPFYIEVFTDSASHDNRGYNCWETLFDKAVVVEVHRKSFVPPSFSSGKGLGVVFDHMVSIATVEYSITTEKSIILMGYSTALIPTSINDDFVQYHFLVSKSGQINLSQFSKELESAISIPNLATLRARYCFIGWCGEVDVRLGTAEFIQTSQPRFSGLDKKKRSLQLSGLSLGVGMAAAAPVQIGPSVQISGAFVTNRVNLTYAGVFSQLLRDSAREMALLYDAEAKRGWIVPKLSFAHIHVSQACSVTEPKQTRFPRYQATQILLRYYHFLMAKVN